MHTEVSLSQVRRNLFGLVNRALTGADKGQRVRPAAETMHGSSLSGTTQVNPIHTKSPLRNTFLTEVVQAWETDWADM